MEKQTIWVSVSDFNPLSGIFIWTIYEVLGGDDDKLYSSKYYTHTPDNSYIHIPPCIHFWTQERADAYIKELKDDDWYITVVIVGEKND